MRVLAPRRAVALEHVLEILVQRERDLWPPLDAAEQQRRSLDGGEAVAPRLTPELAVARRPAGPEHDDVAAGRELGGARRAEIEDRPALRVDRPAQHFGQARPRQADLERGVAEMQGCQARRAERPVLLLRMLQDEKADAVLDRLDRIANAERKRLEAARAIAADGHRCIVGHDPAYRASGRGVQSRVALCAIA